MSYTKTTWVDNSLPSINATNLNNIESGIETNEASIEALKVLFTPKYYYTNSASSLEITPTYDCLCEVETTVSTWGYGGGETTVSITINNNPTTIFNYSGKGNEGNSVARDVSAKALFKLTANTTYTISRNLSNSGGTKSANIIAKIIPYFE